MTVRWHPKCGLTRKRDLYRSPSIRKVFRMICVVFDFQCTEWNTAYGFVQH